MNSQALFEKWQGIEAEPVYYRLEAEALIDKVRRKLNAIDPARVLARRLVFTGPEERIRETRAMWLSSSFYLPPSQMERLLDRLPKLQWIFSQVTGIEHLDADTFKERQVMVSNTGDMSSHRVAEMALAAILAHAKRLPDHIAMQRARRWKSLVSGDVNRQTVGIIGTGNIGNEVARLCAALEMRVIGASRSPDGLRAKSDAYGDILHLDTDLHRLLRNSDHVVIALPLNDETRGLIGQRELSLIKSTASIVNVSRGAIVDEAALCTALKGGTLGSAYIDVPARVPPPRWSRLYRTPHLVLTHYSSANSTYVLEDAFQRFMAGVESLAMGKSPANRVL